MPLGRSDDDANGGCRKKRLFENYWPLFVFGVDFGRLCRDAKNALAAFVVVLLGALDPASHPKANLISFLPFCIVKI